MLETSQRSIAPITGENIKIVREGRLLIDIDRVEIGAPGVTAILGHNGAGKSLLLKVLTGLVKPDSGVIRWGGMVPTPQDYSQLGYMKQNAVLLRRSAKANLEFVLHEKGVTAKQAAEKAEAALEKAGLSHIANSSARVLSGGEKQRLSMIRTLIVDPEIIVLDEPTASLDPQSKAAIERTILELKASGKSVTLVTHDLAQAERLCDIVYFLNQAKLHPPISSGDFFNGNENVEIQKFLSC